MSRPYDPAARIRLSSVAKEVVLIGLAVVAYFGVRGLTEGSSDTAVDNALRVIDVERLLGLPYGQRLQDALLQFPGSETAMNVVYIWAHWPVIFLVACWLFAARHRTYCLLRSTFLISGAVGLIVFATFPVAPPRLIGLGVEDTITEHSYAYRVLQPPAFVNQYAAMPSLHFGWDLLMGGALVVEARWRVFRVLGALLPALMAVAVLATANHFVLDVIAGAVVAALGLLAAIALRRWRERRLPRAGPA
jgi:membrane-associated phospholipid phosphatase